MNREQNIGMFYFSTPDLMINIKESGDYTAHRHCAEIERDVVEKYMITVLAHSHPNYIGPEPELIAHYEKFKNNLGITNQPTPPKMFIPLADAINMILGPEGMQALDEKNQDIDRAVKELKDKSLSGYYRKQIGNKIVDIKKGDNDEKRNELSKLIDAYNLYVTEEKKVSLESIMSFINGENKNE